MRFGRLPLLVLVLLLAAPAGALAKPNGLGP
jgi:hypothetical protein